jgi:hypothetical protein
MAMRHPGAEIVSDHVHGLHASGKKFDYIGVSAFIGDGFTMPLGA